MEKAAELNGFCEHLIDNRTCSKFNGSDTGILCDAAVMSATTTGALGLLSESISICHGGEFDSAEQLASALRVNTASPCTVVNGSLRLYFKGDANLNITYSVVAITEDLEIRNTDLIHIGIEDFPRLRIIGGQFVLRGNRKLASISGLSVLHTVR